MTARQQGGIARRGLRLAAFSALFLPVTCAFAAESGEVFLAQPHGGESARLADLPISIAAPDAAPTAPAAVVTFGRALDLTGQRPAYALRSSISGFGSAVAFSSRKPRPAAAAMASLRSLTLPAGMPLAARSLTSGFGMRSHPLLGGRRWHSGIDLAAPTGTPIAATGDGIVGLADWAGGYGLLVSIEHGGGLQTRYGHLSQLAVQRGQSVRRGDVIGYVGSTGRSTGPHLHYEMRINGAAIDPRR